MADLDAQARLAKAIQEGKLEQLEQVGVHYSLITLRLKLIGQGRRRFLTIIDAR